MYSPYFTYNKTVDYEPDWAGNTSYSYDIRNNANANNTNG